MNSDLPEALRRLSQVKVFDYFKNKSMPEFVEPLITELVSSYASYTEVQQRQLLSAISSELSGVFGWYARKLAGRAVRESSRTDLWNGLVALLISTYSGDLRDAMAPLALLHNSALRLQQDPKALFEEVSKISIQRISSLFETFLRRPPDLRTIQAFGFSEGAGPNGFDYLPLLPEYGGPTPL